MAGRWKAGFRYGTAISAGDHTDGRRVVLASITALASLAISGPAVASTKTTRATATPKLTQLGHVTFWECSAKTTEMLVVVNTLTLHPGQTLDITFTVRNLAATGCNYTVPVAGTAAGAAATTLQAAPAGPSASK